MNKKFLIIFLILITTNAVGEIYQCDFSSDKFREGKPNKISCSGDPEEVFSSKYNKPEVWEHCDIEKIFRADSIKDMIIDTESKIVFYKTENVPTEYSKKRMYNYYIKKGETEQVAKEKSERIYPSRENLLTINSITSGKEKIYYNEKLKKSYDPVKIIDTKFIIFSDEIYSFGIYIPNISHGKSILFANSTSDNSTWTELRFGHCENENS